MILLEISRSLIFESPKFLLTKVVSTEKKPIFRISIKSKHRSFQNYRQ